MDFTINLPNNVSITTDSSAGVRSVLDELGLIPEITQSNKPVYVLRAGLSERAQKLLVTLKQIQPSQIAAQELVNVVGAKSVKGIGPIIHGIKNELSFLGLKPNNVIVSMVGRDGPSWMAGPDIDEALRTGGIEEETT